MSRTKVSVVRIKTFEEASAAALDAAYETWRAEQGENILVSAHLSNSGTDLVLTVFYTR